jgi:hypothetical protein
MRAIPPAVLTSMLPPAAPPTLFSFGYWGAGSATRALVHAFNDAEALRGFNHPLWVDVRISRSVRALGFRERTFEYLLGSHYAWMPDLGNVRVLKHGKGIEIRNPAAAEELLGHALRSPKRRVIFFCSCELPIQCHRHEVARLVKEAATRRGIDANVIEWPGGQPSPTSIDINVSALVLRAVRGGRKTLDLPNAMEAVVATSLPWGTRAVLRADTDELSVLLGPAHFVARGSHLKILATDPANDDAAAFRESGGYERLA